MSKVICCQIIGGNKKLTQARGDYRHKRTILKNLTNEKVIFYIFIQNCFSYYYTPDYLENKDNVFSFKNNEELDSLLKKYNIQKILMSQQLHPSGWFKCMLDFNPDNMYFIAHGLANPITNKQRLSWWYETMRLTNINMIVACKTQYDILSQSRNEKLFKIGTLAQIDNLVLNKKKNKSILITDQGNYHFGNQIGSKDRELILNWLTTMFNYPVYYKPVNDYPNNIVEKFKNIKDVSKKDDKLTYDFFDSEIIICINYGTSYTEALLSGSKVILYLLEFLNPERLKIAKQLTPSAFNHFSADVATSFDSDKYKHLLVARNVNDFKKALTIIKNDKNYFESDVYLKDKELFIKDSLGNYIPDINKQLIDIITK